jgi:FkbM family methyltransferase
MKFMNNPEEYDERGQLAQTKIDWKYRVRIFLGREIPSFFRAGRFLKDLHEGKIKGDFWKELTEALLGKIFHSQFGEDREVYEAFFSRPQMRKGFYVELGAADGVSLSNTKMFRDFLGWRGLLIEPVPELFERLKMKRPGDILVNAAVSEKEGDVEFLGKGTTAGMVHAMCDAHKKTFYPGETSTYPVKGVPFRKILSQARVRAIDFLSIDAEGGELEVLKPSIGASPSTSFALKCVFAIQRRTKNAADC